MLKLAYDLEKKCYNQSYLITGQTNGIVKNILSRFPDKKVFWLPNGVDLDFYNPAKIKSIGFRKKHGFNENQILFFYGGIIGYAQGLQIILEAAKLLENSPEAHFIIQGAGPEKEKLQSLKESLKLENVHFLEPVSKNQMPSILKEIDIALVPLRKLELFQGAIPSKIFESLSMEVPLLLGVDGEARHHFIDNAKAGLYFEPENVNDLVANIQFLIANKDLIYEMGKNGRQYVFQHFNRNKIALDFYKELI